MKRLSFEPLDVLMFRSERPFTAIESHVAKLGVISPLAFEGAIKSKIFTDFCYRKGYSPSDFQRERRREESEENFKKSKEELIKTLREKIDKDKELKDLLETIGYSPLGYTSKLNVLGVFLAEKDKQLENFPVPKDIVRKDNKNGAITKLIPSQKIKLLDSGFSVVFSSYSKVKDIDGLIDFNELRRYLWGEIPQIKRIEFYERELKRPWVEETRSGIKLEKESKITKEGALYSAEFLRLLDEWRFTVWYESPQNIPNGLVKLGGEGKGALCENIKEININEKLDSFSLIKEINEDKMFKLYLATPSYFGGCMPPNDKLERMLGVSLKLIAAIPGKPVYIGGYDFAMNKEKPLRRWVSAGAVYYYTFDGEIDTGLSLPIKIIDDGIDIRCAFIGIGGNKDV